MEDQGTRDLVCANIGAPRDVNAHMMAFAIGDKVTRDMYARGLASEDATRWNFMGLILEEIETILEIGRAQGRAMERSDGVCRALFNFE